MTGTLIWLAQNPSCGRTVVGLEFSGQLRGPRDAIILGSTIIIAGVCARLESRKRSYRAPEQNGGWWPQFLMWLGIMPRPNFVIRPDDNA